MKNVIAAAIFIVLVALLAVFIQTPPSGPEIKSFEDCVKAGYPVMESYPPQCAVPGGPTFTEDSCQYKKGEDVFILTISDAKNIAINSECGDRLKETYSCNEYTGTYWIDLDIEKEGCNPACVVHLDTREAEINWRCTGVVTCAKEGEQFSAVYEEYPDHCCEGLTEWHSGMDTRISIADECYETGLVAGSPVGTCINCGNGICEEIEDPCNCPEDCIGKNSSDYLSIEEFCQSDKWEQTLSVACQEGYPEVMDLSICELC